MSSKKTEKAEDNYLMHELNIDKDTLKSLKKKLLKLNQGLSVVSKRCFVYYPKISTP